MLVDIFGFELERTSCLRGGYANWDKWLQLKGSEAPITFTEVYSLKCQKEGQEDKGTLKQLVWSLLVLSPTPGSAGIPFTSSMSILL